MAGESVRVIEPDAERGGAVGLELRCGLAEERRRIGQIGFGIDDVAGGEREAVADGLLVGRMDVVGRADVEGDGHGGIGELEGSALRIADAAPVLGRRIEAGNLHEKEGEIALRELHPPVADEGCEERVVIRGAVVRGVGFALIPDEAANGHRDEGRDHAVVEAGRGPRGFIGMPSVGASGLPAARAASSSALSAAMRAWRSVCSSAK